ncbi:hypothetical protein [Xanthovirga aplysinae]|uniref:hypothetical protein n=1 Tax=Xanthovirga aplysinae TaxID=2529853 RepID=UPI0012BC91AB|nr:hypothetical protein [Xanthovirga aplysinae]MTI29735.1 hypothetical protein [Xanthovirga aplysinae]
MGNTIIDNDHSKECEIINNSGTDAVVIIPALAQSNNIGSNVNIYNQRLELLSTLEGGQVIPSGQSGTVVLDQTYNNPMTGQPTYSKVYKLLISSSDWYHPLAVINVKQKVSVDPPRFDPQTINADNQKSMEEAGLFIQTLHADPTSPLIKSFKDMMSDVHPDAARLAEESSESSKVEDVNTITDKASNFFKSTDDFQNVTLNSIGVMRSYYKKFPFIWAQFKNLTYNLYTSDDQTNTFLGQISMSKPNQLDIKKPNAGYIINFLPASDPSNLDSTAIDSSQTVSINYMNGIFIIKGSVGSSKTMLRGSFIFKSALSQNPDDNQIIPILTGKVNGGTTTGYDESLMQ